MIIPDLGKFSSRTNTFKNAWIHRLISPSQQLIGFDGDQVRFVINKYRSIVLSNLEKPSIKTNMGANCLISNPDLTEFIVTRKDNLHPIPEFCNNLALFGGGVEEDDPYHTILRELYEEISIPIVVDSIAERIKFIDSKEVEFTSNKLNKNYVINQYLYLAKANSTDEYDFWRKSFTSRGIVTEANVEIINKQQMMDAINSNAFIANLSEIIKKVF